MTFKNLNSIEKSSREKEEYFNDLKENISNQIDWNYINKLKEDPQEFHMFMQEGQDMFDIVSTLQAVTSKP